MMKVDETKKSALDGNLTEKEGGKERRNKPKIFGPKETFMVVERME